MEALDKLFEGWESKHLLQGHKRFIRDGIVDEEWWMNVRDVPKICFFLKEARTQQEEGYNLVNDLKEYAPWRLWQRVGVWTQAIQNAYIGKKVYNDAEIKNHLHEAVKQIAVVNIKKSDGMAESDNDDLQRYALEDNVELKKELELINPDIIVCGYTFGMLKEILNQEEVDFCDTSDTMYGFWRDKLVIDYYHPACHYPNRINYYALISICHAASQEWSERRKKYTY